MLPRSESSLSIQFCTGVEHLVTRPYATRRPHRLCPTANTESKNTLEMKKDTRQLYVSNLYVTTKAIAPKTPDSLSGPNASPLTNIHDVDALLAPSFLQFDLTPISFQAGSTVPVVAVVKMHRYCVTTKRRLVAMHKRATTATARTAFPPSTPATGTVRLDC